MGNACSLYYCAMGTLASSLTFTAFAPTLTSAEAAKDKFCQELDNAVNATSKSDCIYILGDLNASVGSDSDSWPVCLGKFNIGRMNENGKKFVGIRTRNDLCITNSIFATRECQIVTWKHPGSGHLH
jgi:hypothetical protein